MGRAFVFGGHTVIVGEDMRLYLNCPDCGRQYPRPFVRGQIHFRRCTSTGHTCRRFVVAVDPAADDHWFRPVGEQEDYEAVHDRIADDQARRVRRAVLLYAAEDAA